MANLNFTIPAAAQANDYLEAYVLSVGGDSTLTPPPTGWQYIRTISVNNNVGGDVYGKIASATDHGTHAIWTITGGTGAAGVMFDIIGATGEDDYKAAARADTFVSTPGDRGATPLNALTSNELVIVIILVHGSVNLVPPSPWNTIREFQSANLSVLGAQMTTTQAGAVPSFTIDFGGNNFDSFCAAISYLGTSSFRTFSVA